MEWIKGLLEFVAGYSTWAKATIASGFALSLGTLILASRSSEGDKAVKVTDAASARLIKKLGQKPNYAPLVSPHLGFGVQVKSIWTVEDAAARFGGGDVNIIKRYEDTKAAIGMTFRLRSVQRNYITDSVAEETNELDVLRLKCPSAPPTMERFSAANREGTVFHYCQPTGKRVGDVRLYWLRLIPQVKLEIFAFIYQDSGDRYEFWKEVEAVIQSLVLDDDEVFSAKAKTLGS